MIGKPDAAAIVRSCSTQLVPVGAPVREAIAAHRMAPSEFTLRAVLMAQAPTALEDRAILDHLVGLADAAWQEVTPDGWSDFREQTLESFRRRIAWGTICA